MRSSLRLATSLEEIEESHDRHPQASQQSHQFPERYQGKEPRSLPREHFHVAQIIYDLQNNWPAWKRLVFKAVYLPLFRFFDKRVGILPPVRVEPDGTYSWLAHQGCFLTEAEAQLDASRYPFGYVVPHVPLGSSLTEDIPEKSSIYFQKELPRPSLAPIVEEARRLRTAVHTAARIT
jgi:hypothetical protein